MVMYMNGTIYIVTGAAGHLGGHVTRQLLEKGKNVRAFVLPSERSHMEKIQCAKLEIFSGDICDPDSLKAVFEKKEGMDFIVIHCAGIISILEKEDECVRRVNVEGTANMIGACKKYGVKRLVYISSVHAIPEQPQGVITYEAKHFSPELVRGCYAKTKAEATQLVLDASAEGLNAVVIHPAGIIGPGAPKSSNMMHLIIKFAGGKLPAAVHGGFDFVDVRDVAAGVVAASESGKNRECYILGSKWYDLREFFDLLAEAAHRKKLKLYLPFWAVKLFVPIAETYYKLANKTPLFTSYSLFTLRQNAIYSHEKAQKEFGYKVRPLKETFQDILAYLKEEGILG